MLTFEHLLTVKQLAEKCPAFTEASIRWKIFNAEMNGLDRALVKVGSRVYIDVPEFEAWLESQRLGEVESESLDGAKR